MSRHAVQHAPRTGPGLGRRVLAALFAVGLAAPLALPAYASPAPAESSQGAVAPLGRQTLRITTADLAAAPIERDGYAATVRRPLVPGGEPYAATADTFVNPAGGAVQWPFRRGVPISDWFGAREAPCALCSSEHNGIDMNPGLGTPVQIIADGVVRETGNPSGELGVYAIIDHVIGGRRVSSVYAHMLPGSLQVRVGDRVRVADIVAQVGNSGLSTGPHLHFGILDAAGTPIDPYAFMKAEAG